MVDQHANKIWNEVTYTRTEALIRLDPLRASCHTEGSKARDTSFHRKAGEAKRWLRLPPRLKKEGLGSQESLDDMRRLSPVD